MTIDTTESDAALRTTLRDVWGYDSFRPHQQAAMRAVLGRRDSLVVLPTGGGKSICFQAPALLRPGTAVVISPLISLMRDQVAQLRQSGVEAGCLHSGQPPDERQSVVWSLRSGVLKLLYVSPERLALENVASILNGSQLSFVAVDEAHCVSMWGHDFRPEYRQIARLREQFPDVDMHAFTATATREVSSDIVEQLVLRDPVVLRGSFDRPNFFYAARPRRGGFDMLLEVVHRHRDQSGIVYCISRKETENTAEKLRSHGFSAVAYHAGMDPAMRIANQDDFVADRVNIVVATIAFGMGINKPDVRFIVHMGMPKSLENYQQESGRAGRDGLPAECLLLYSLGDLMTWKRIGSDAPPELQVAANQQLNRIHDWCERRACRRVGLLAHFDEVYPRANCGMCDHCTGGQRPIPDSHVIAQKILSCIKRLDEQHNTAYTADVLHGSTAKKIIEAEHDKLSTHGLLKDHPRNHILDWIEQLRAGGFIEVGEEGGHLRVSETGWQILRNRATGILLDRLAPTSALPKAMDEDLTPEQVETFGRLRARRKEIAEQQKVPPYVVFGDVTLRDIARKRPRSLDEFLSVKGVGRKKLKSYGKAFLDALWEGAPPAVDEQAAARIPLPKDPRAIATRLFAEELGVVEVAERIGRMPSTVEGYLVDYIHSHGIADATPWVPRELQPAIEAALDLSADGKLRPVLDALDGKATYCQIRVVRACRANRGEG